MKNYCLVVAALLLAQPANVAVAAEFPEQDHAYDLTDAGDKHTSKKARKVLVLLRAIGVNDPDVMEFVQGVDARSQDGYLTLHEEKLESGSLKLGYAMEGKVGIKQMELRYEPEDSHMTYSARPTGVLAQYKVKF